jgi:predicted small secreted protein
VRTGWAFRAIAGLVALSLGLAACNGGSSTSGAGSDLRDGMAAVSDNPLSRRFFAWADQSELRKLTGITSYTNAGNAKKVNATWSRLVAAAVPDLAGLEPQITSATGIDVYKGDRAMTVGVPPDTAGRIDGADAGAVGKQLKVLGVTPQAGKGLSIAVLAPDDQVAAGNPHLGGDVYLALNRVAVKGSTVAFGLASGPLNVVLGGGRSLADDADESAMAECLGDVVVAQVGAPPAGAATGVTLVGVGVRRPQSATDRVSEVLCEVAGNSTDAVASAMVAHSQSDSPLPGRGLHVRDRVAQAVVDQFKRGDIRVARLTIDLVALARAGFLLLDQGSSGAGVAYLGGGSTPPTGSQP